ncbi:MAG TPA: adenylate/guanylate cyclase domain-containing protein [Myxococcota bacterium]|nr:adenylate/guanylate cyclase domain-containing protein [Myxococcota bacterium]
MLKRIFSFTGFKLGLLITLVFCATKLPACGLSESGAVLFLDNIENAWLDEKFDIRGQGSSDEFQKKAHVVIVAIDEKSTRMPDLGLWPWPRSKIAEMVAQLNKCGAKVIGFDVVFSEPDASRTEPVVRQIKDAYAKTEPRDTDFERHLDEIYAGVQGDRALANVLENAENVVLGYFFFCSHKEIINLDPRDIQAGKESIGFGTISFAVKPEGHSWDEMRGSFPQALGVRANLPILSEAADSYGYFNQIPDGDSIYRHVPMVMVYDKHFYPSLSLQVLSSYYDQPVELLVNTFDRKTYYPRYIGLYLGPIGMPGPNHVEVPVERGALFRVNYYGGNRMFRHVSAGDIIHADQEACRAVRGKVVLVGATTIGIYDLRPTPLEDSFPGVEIHASVIENVIRQDFMLRPAIFYVYEALFMLLAGILFSWLLMRFRLTIGLVITLLSLVGLVLADFFFLFRNGIQVHVVLPVMHLVVLFAGIAVYRYATEEREKSKIRHAFQFYLSKDVIEDVMRDTSKLKLGGERRELTVMFSDIRGFTTISEKLDPEALTELLNEYLTPMTEIVFAQHGTLDKYIGDALMAIFGAPLPFADHPHAACRAALEMMETLARLRQVWAERGLPEIDIGIGVNTGAMSVGNMGSASRFDYTVLGDNVNLASRLEGLNKVYHSHIIISEFTRAAVGGHFTCRELDAVQVKGKQRPVKIYELIHRGPTDPGKDGWIGDFEAALQLYRTQQWNAAAAAFGKLESDPTSAVYIQRCQQMKDDPPGSDWNGVCKMTSK